MLILAPGPLWNPTLWQGRLVVRFGLQLALRVSQTDLRPFAANKTDFRADHLDGMDWSTQHE